MKLFFESVIDEVFNNLVLEKTYFIIPNQRSKAFLKREILKKLSSITISPQIYSIDDFIEKIADSKEASRTNQLFYLYESYMKVSQKKDFESYSVFRNWANTLLNDNNDIDMALADSSDVFSDLYNIHKIQAFSDESKEKALAFWSMIPNIIKDFKHSMNQNNLSTKGMCHTFAKDNIELFSNANKEFSFIFLGLNSLSNSEQLIVNYLLENNNTKIFWDCDESFMSGNEHEAGYFFKKYINNWDFYKSNKFDWTKNLFSSSKNIFIYETTKQIAQVKTAANLIQEISKDKSLNNTAIILPKKELLTPLINSIPSTLENLSMSISISLINMPLSKFAMSFFEMYSNKKSKSFYYKDLINVLSSSFFNKIDDQHETTLNSFRSSIINKNMIYVNEKHISRELNNQDVSKMFACTETSIIDTLISYINDLESNIDEPIFLEQSSKIKSTLLIMKNFNQRHSFSISFESLKDFFFDIAKNQSINFYGDPTGTPHIMGLLESRGMDFENVIICSANEGILPSNNFYNSLLPFDLRKKHNLTTIIEDDARTSYDFYHLLMRATNIHLIYNSVPDGLDSGEKSRYIYQLELLKKENHTIKNIVSHYHFDVNDISSEKYKKTKSLILRLNEMAESGFSPSSLNTYIENPINFFNDHILRVKKPEEVKENPEARGIGIIFHNVMETLYKQYEGKKLEIEELELNLKNIDITLNNEFINEYGKNHERGKNIIIYQVLRDTIQKLIENDIKKIKKGIEIKIIDIESKLELNLITDNLKIKYKLRGIVDRIQSEDGKIIIIDYKTGLLEAYKLIFNDYNELIEKKKKEAFQLLCYCLMYSYQNKEINNLEAGIISFKNMNHGLMSLKKSNTSYYDSNELNEFKKTLDNLIEEIFNPEISFEEK